MPEYPSMHELTRADLDVLMHFADAEIAAGRYLAGARLRALLESHAECMAHNFKRQLEENESMARELRDEIGTTRNELSVLLENISSALDGLDAVVSLPVTQPRPAPGAQKALRHARNAAAHEAAFAFRGALQDVQSRLSTIAKRIDEHAHAADEAGTPLEEFEPDERKRGDGKGTGAS